MTTKTAIALHAQTPGSPVPADQGGPSLARQRTAREFLRYFAASVVALGVDVALFQLGLRLGCSYLLAACVGFMAGAVIAYVSSIRWVFDSRSLRNSGLEFGLFAAIGIAGLLLTELLLWVAIGQLRLPPLVSKIGTSGIVFIFNFGVRKTLLFRSRAA